ncbi:aminotransferase class I/II-fold pyridoxal phosphate-dependent enzyme [Venenivibrio stagnispumantis]|uniref:Aminotransferase n=1 Tax=Venenivibrio stagnispumantis TaxID=407998 RepID=A0AA45WM54_9AQUI|nr:aminotransferase class I/II-fold pyridoxal phosphate-dependent enzyme [Venenivibrio stagnispumantis]MCW4572835.1 aminotransferase class I/II-fold pyridoxal phosphate-dependent enzyme [Venenivibrio stagnispumantis]SMP13495.1 alanine-synthesizing transaminase [Venenivibrio stagnispumantis]
MPEEFPRIKRLPHYVFATINELKAKMRKEGEDIIDFGMGNPDLAPAQHIIDKLCEAAKKKTSHRYSMSQGIPRLRKAIAEFYKKRYDVDIDPETEAIMTIGSKEAIDHLMLAMLEPGDIALVPSPRYPIHYYAPVIAGASVLTVPLPLEGTDDEKQEQFLKNIYESYEDSYPEPKVLILNFPNNPTTMTVTIDFFKEVIKFAKKKGMWIVHDLAYGDLCFDGYKAPSILQVEGAKDIAAETYSMTKGFSMAGWRVGFLVGNETLVYNLKRLKSYFDYGTFTPIQVASIVALEGDYSVVEKARDIYSKRLDVLVQGLNRIGWKVEKPKATMFLWAKIPEKFAHLGSIEFSKMLITEAKVAVAPGVGFGEHGEGYVRFAVVENEKRIRQAISNMKKLFKQ